MLAILDFANNDDTVLNDGVDADALTHKLRRLIIQSDVECGELAPLFHAHFVEVDVV